MTIVYRCDKCGQVKDGMTISGFFPVKGAKSVVIHWGIRAAAGEIERHLCHDCVLAALIAMQKGER